jgi:TolB protein
VINQYHPAVDGTRMVWEQRQNSLSKIYCKNFATGKTILVSQSTSNQHNPAISGTRIVWEQYNKGVLNIFWRDISGGNTFIVHASKNAQTDPAISGSRIVWVENQKIICSNLNTGHTNVVHTSQNPQSHPKISGTRIVWNEVAFDYYIQWEVFVKDLATDKTSNVYNLANDMYDPSISGTRIVWTMTPNMDLDDPSDPVTFWSSIEYKDLKNNKVNNVHKVSNLQKNPIISGSIIVWLQQNGSNYYVYYKNLKTNVQGYISSTYNASQLAFSGNRAAWVEYHSGKYVIMNKVLP